MNIDKELITLIGTIFAAFIAGFITFIISILSKEQKTSEFRQAWIDALRSDISELLGVLTTIIAFIRFQVENKTNDEIRDYFLQKYDDLAKLQNLLTRILLRVNPDEHVKFLSILEEGVKIESINKYIKDYGAEKEFYNNLVREAQLLLKKEWKRVKRGEPIFMIIKWGSFVIFLASIIIIILYLQGHLIIKFNP